MYFKAYIVEGQTYDICLQRSERSTWSSYEVFFSRHYHIVSGCYSAGYNRHRLGQEVCLLRRRQAGGWPW